MKDEQFLKDIYRIFEYGVGPPSSCNRCIYKLNTVFKGTFFLCLHQSFKKVLSYVVNVLLLLSAFPVSQGWPQRIIILHIFLSSMSISFAPTSPTSSSTTFKNLLPGLPLLPPETPPPSSPFPHTPGLSPRHVHIMLLTLKTFIST